MRVVGFREEREEMRPRSTQGRSCDEVYWGEDGERIRWSKAILSATRAEKGTDGRVKFDLLDAGVKVRYRKMYSLRAGCGIVIEGR
jgi:hypothetical protein